MIATKQDPRGPANTQTHLTACLNNATGDLPSNVQNKHKLYTADAAAPPSSSKDEAPHFELVTWDSLHAHDACGRNEAHTRAEGHRSLMTLSILFTTSLLMASSSGRGEMKLEKSIISS